MLVRVARVSGDTEGLRVPAVLDDPVVFTCALEARRETVYFLAGLIHRHCEHLGTRDGTRVLGPFREALVPAAHTAQD
jgi:hypothetical protein